MAHVKLPCAECKGQCCTFPGFTNKEYKKVRDKYGLPAGTQSRRFGDKRMLYVGDGNCPYLQKTGACGIYEDRPKVCRLYGEIPELPCQYLYPDKANDAVNKLLG